MYSSASGVDVCVVAVQRGAEGLSSRDVPFGPGEGAALERRVEGMQRCAWGVHSVAVQASACIKAGLSMLEGRCERARSEYTVGAV